MGGDAGGFCFGSQFECAEGLSGAAAERTDEPAIVLVGDLAGAMVELELLQRCECAVAFLGECKAALLELVRSIESIVDRGRVAQKRQRDDDRGEDRDYCPDYETRCHASANA